MTGRPTGSCAASSRTGRAPMSARWMRGWAPTRCTAASSKACRATGMARHSSGNCFPMSSAQRCRPPRLPSALHQRPRRRAIAFLPAGPAALRRPCPCWRWSRCWPGVAGTAGTTRQAIRCRPARRPGRRRASSCPMARAWPSTWTANSRCATTRAAARWCWIGARPSSRSRPARTGPSPWTPAPAASGWWAPRSMCAPGRRGWW